MAIVSSIISKLKNWSEEILGLNNLSDSEKERIKNFFQLSGETKRIESGDDFFIEAVDNSEFKDIEYRPDSLEGSSEYQTRIRKVIFRNVSFTRTQIRKIDFRHCRFENCLFISSEIEDCEFHHCEFIDTNMHKVVFNNTYIDPRSFSRSQDRRYFQNIGAHLYQALMRNSRHTDQPEFEAIAHFQYHKWKRYQHLHDAREPWRRETKAESGKSSFSERLSASSPYIGKYLKGLFWEKTTGSGIKFSILARTAAIVVLSLTLINMALWKCFGLDDCDCNFACSTGTFFDSLYFTVITLTTVGYGDITPSSLSGKIVIPFEGVLGFLLFALLASMFYRKISP